MGARGALFSTSIIMAQLVHRGVTWLNGMVWMKAGLRTAHLGELLQHLHGHDHSRSLRRRVQLVTGGKRLECERFSVVGRELDWVCGKVVVVVVVVSGGEWWSVFVVCLRCRVV